MVDCSLSAAGSVGIVSVVVVLPGVVFTAGGIDSVGISVLSVVTGIVESVVAVPDVSASGVITGMAGEVLFVVTGASMVSAGVSVLGLIGAGTCSATWHRD